MRFAKPAALIGGLIVSLGLGTVAGAEDEMSFERTDTNGDGCVSWEELRNASIAVWGAMDLNGDGLITGEELPPVTNEKGETVRTRGTIDLAVFQAALDDAFEAADKDKDGCLNRPEFEQ